MNSRCILFVLNFILRVKVVGFYKKGNIFKQVFAIRKHWGKNTTTINIWSYSTIFYIVKMESGFKINILGEKMIGTHFLLLQKREDFLFQFLLLLWPGKLCINKWIIACSDGNSTEHISKLTYTYFYEDINLNRQILCLLLLHFFKYVITDKLRQSDISWLLIWHFIVRI